MNDNQISSTGPAHSPIPVSVLLYITRAGSLGTKKTPQPKTTWNGQTCLFPPTKKKKLYNEALILNIMVLKGETFGGN